MKKTVSFLAGLLAMASLAVAAPDMVQITSATVQTNGASTATYTPDNDVFLSAWLDSVIVDFTGAPASSNVITITTLASQGTGAARTLLTLTDTTTDAVYPVRDIVSGQSGSDISNVPARIPLVQDKLRMTAIQGSGGTNTSSVTVYFILSPVP